jgi:asparagine synthase (glutamine-hydrolysing)
MRRWWRPETLAPLRGMAREEMHQRFVALYRDAVRQRLRSSTGSVAATLSGGLDSGSVVALAAPALAERGEVLDAYVHTPRFEADPDAAWAGRTPNEWQLANATARHVGNVRTIECPTPDVSPLQGIRRGLDVIGVPSHAACSLFWILDIVQQARVAGAGVLLVGDGGNATVSYSGTGNLWPRLQALDAAAALGELVRDEAGTWRASYRRIVKPALRPFWQWLQRSRFKTAGYSTDVTRGLINESLARHVGLEAAVAAAHHDPSFRSVHASRLALWRLGLLRGAANTATTSQMSAAFNIEVRDPTRDQRLVEFCARLPDEVFWSNGRQRGLIRTAMRSSLPPEVRDSRRKGLQAADLRARLRASQGEVLSELAAVSRHEVVRDWLDIPGISAAIHAALDHAVATNAGTIDAADALRALAVAMFLTRHA